MKKIKTALVIDLIVAIILLALPSYIFASTGARTSPYSGFINRTLVYQEYDFYEPKTIELQLMEVINGEIANQEVQNENMFNQIPTEDEEWILFRYHLKYVSGPEEELYASDVISTFSSFYTLSGTAIAPFDTATFSGERSGLGQYDVSMYPGGESDIWYGILVQKTVGYPMYRVATGYNTTTYNTIYTWFSSDPAYQESIEPEPPAIPTSLSASSATYNSIKLTWTAVSGASGYVVYRASSLTGTYTYLASSATNNFTNTGLTTGTVYYYKVRAYRTVDTTKVYSNYSTAVSGKPVLSTPGNFKATSTGYNSAKVTWTAVAGASGYEVYRKLWSSGAYSLVGSPSTNSLSDSGLAMGKTYYYKVRAYRLVGTTKVYSAETGAASVTPVLAVPTGLKAASTGYNSAKITWTAVAGASGYEVYRKLWSSGTLSLVSTQTGTSFSNSGLATNKTYYYKVRAYRLVGTTKVYSKDTTFVTVTPVPSAPTGLKVVSGGSKTAKVTWTSVAGASGYEVWRKMWSSGTYAIISTQTSTSLTNTGLAINKTYYYKVRAYRMVGTSKVYGPDSAVVTYTPLS